MGLLNFESFNGADFLNLDVLAKQIFKFERFAKWIKFMRCLRGSFLAAIEYITLLRTRAF